MEWWCGAWRRSGAKPRTGKGNKRKKGRGAEDIVPSPARLPCGPKAKDPANLTYLVVVDWDSYAAHGSPDPVQDPLVHRC